MGHQGNFKTARYPDVIYLGTLGIGINAVALQTILATLEKLAGNQIVETTQDDSKAASG
jgi:hypothetical protein